MIDVRVGHNRLVCAYLKTFSQLFSVGQTRNLFLATNGNSDGLTRYDLNRQSSCAKFLCCRIHRSELQAETDLQRRKQKTIFDSKSKLFAGHLKGKRLRLNNSLQNHKTIGGHVDIAAVLNFILHIWIHSLTHKHIKSTK